MRIIDMIRTGGKFVSLEFFPPKDPQEWPGFFQTVERLAAVDPLFVSVTYGAGGGTQGNTLEIVRRLRRDMGLTPMAHLTCVGASAERVDGFLSALEEADVHNVLALRGDPPKGDAQFVPDSDQFRHASDLVTHIRRHYPDMGVGVAGYPEGHPECSTFREDFEFLKFKLDRGGDFAITQLFFDARLYWNFTERLGEMGVKKPIIPGVLPVMSVKSAKRVLGFCGASIPGRLLLDLEEADARGGAEAACRVGLEWAKRQCRELLEGGAPGVHLYTLNRPEACLEIVGGLDL
ncbi:methylenetetrahydrofolate reductase [Desulfocurvus vexinensis]|uniref:methylenetetrahydrofolate reductase n=1 Tax=Desulfocurvus vexinensis TaxID=399548 RepID=UPI0004909A15|nr:methylenetetrahydrofolate reductase [Desulfocurvus vexinensis]